MTEKKTTKEKEPDYSEFCIKFAKLCFKVVFGLQRLIYKGLKHVYHRIQVWLAWRQLKRDIRECAECKAYFQE